MKTSTHRQDGVIENGFILLLETTKINWAIIRNESSQRTGYQETEQTNFENVKTNEVNPIDTLRILHPQNRFLIKAK